MDRVRVHRPIVCLMRFIPLVLPALPRALKGHCWALVADFEWSEGFASVGFRFVTASFCAFIEESWAEWSV
jgi:hypothetical protein